MNNDKTIKNLSALALLLMEEEEEDLEKQLNKSVKRKVWVRDFYKRGATNMNYYTLIKDLRMEGPEFYRQHTRISENGFLYLANKIRKRVQKQDTNMRAAITVEERLSITLKYLATGDSLFTLSQLYRIGRSTTREIILEVCVALYMELKDEMIKIPGNESEWKELSNGFFTKWNYPNCLGALDGKHINCKSPPRSGSAYYNYKGSFSIVLMALADANYKFTYVNIGAKGSSSDGGVFSDCALYRKLIQSNELNIPQDEPLPNRTINVPYVIVADDAFAISEHIMKPFARKNLCTMQRIYNYRLSRARRIIENTFGISSARFRVLRNTIELFPANVTKIVQAVCVLHNFCMTKEKENYAPPGTFDTEEMGNFVSGSWRQDIPVNSSNPDTNRSHNTTEYLEKIRQEFMEYFVSFEGELPWQYNSI